MIKHGKKVLLTTTIRLTTITQQAQGLRGKTIRPQEAYIFTLPMTSRFFATVDMFFIKQPLLLIWLNNKTIVDIREAQPWSIHLPKEPANMLIETHLHNKKKFHVGQQLTIT